ncbi:U-box domain-containing protein 54-like [Impatiens glandulifera]|uniref:U-box domain-containing protein 54-like n=1 Tax=Impatiens glandulifera TaxID=253017 RepID=UPI001FB11D8F|nr:U-box domain-containing protein 54-like [Impatiens glandulifera]
MAMKRVSEIEEENINTRERTPALAPVKEDDDVVYVVISGEEKGGNRSMDALLWTLKNEVAEIFLVHVFPEIRFIPTPLGKLPINQANPEQKQILMEQERNKRREYLFKFLNLCSESKVKVDTILIESDMEAKAILDLIPILNIKKLILGSPTKSSLKKLIKLRRKENGVADKVFDKAPHFCQVKIICQGKEISKSIG